MGGEWKSGLIGNRSSAAPALCEAFSPITRRCNRDQHDDDVDDDDDDADSDDYDDDAPALCSDSLLLLEDAIAISMMTMSMAKMLVTSKTKESLHFDV